ncbi:MAG TPA: hypothetical protein PKA33_01810 [Amaricoccus sp.]|uniref:hypothetical protein n=1 Tax=Amaricoccus sp. TaxID=1872485 RepID=UPI002D15E6E2|nr:hypothetical protein [Amaricoccus sp.]HMQ38137.1 hypothetical protein [Micropruina sp.]HMR51169.1 hypothetical protein [Amaricoccus sp.]HMT98083.1 hypothetical protein [Amaricoccus sp.]
MIAAIRRALARRRAVRAEGAALVAMHGSAAAVIALWRADVLSGAERHYWLDVARFAGRWHAHLAALDTATRYLEEGRYLAR